jgi:RNA polymerase sigma factor (sigma-70 family)
VEAASAPRPHALRIPRPRRLLAGLPDDRLVEYVRRGEQAAFEVLYDRYSAGILSFCRHMLRSTADAEDATQHTFMAAHADIARRGERELYVKAWLYTIARNRCLSLIRARREQVANDDIEIVDDRFSNDVEQREDLRALLADVRRLPDDQREALVLAEVGDLTHDDISAVIGCEVNKVKSLVFQARTALIDRRLARETPCDQIREQIATLRGGALRRSHLRHHVEACAGCSEYREQIRRQRAMLAVALPIVPSAALRANVFGGLGFGGGSAAVGGVGATAGGATTAATASSTSVGVAVMQGGLAKVGIAVALAAGGGGAAVAANNGGIPLLHHPHPATKASSPSTHRDDAAGGSATHGRVATQKDAADPGTSTSKHKTKTTHRSASGAAHGFTPTPGTSSGAAARERAKTRGQRKQTGVTKQTATKTNPAGQAHKKAAPVKAGPKAHAVPRRPLKQPAAKAPAKAAPKQQTAPTPETTPAPAPQGKQQGATSDPGALTPTAPDVTNQKSGA